MRIAACVCSLCSSVVLQGAGEEESDAAAAEASSADKAASDAEAKSAEKAKKKAAAAKEKAAQQITVTSQMILDWQKRAIKVSWLRCAR